MQLILVEEILVPLVILFCSVIAFRVLVDGVVKIINSSNKKKRPNWFVSGALVSLFATAALSAEFIFNDVNDLAISIYVIAVSSSWTLLFVVDLIHQSSVIKRSKISRF